MTATTGMFTTTDGVELLTRSWTIESPRYDIFLVHGLGEHSDRWDYPALYFNARGANVFSYDLRGHGASGGNRIDIESFDEFHRDISQLASSTAAATGRPWVLYGHSLGGLQCAGYLIDRIEPIPNVAVLTAPAMMATRGIDKVLKAAVAVLGRVAPTTTAPNKITAEQLSSDPAIGEAYFADPLVETKATMRFGKTFFAEQDRLVDHQGDIGIPTFVIHGADDELVQPAASAGLASSPGVERRVYPGIRHELHNEPERDRILGDINDWIDTKLF